MSNEWCQFLSFSINELQGARPVLVELNGTKCYKNCSPGFLFLTANGKEVRTIASIFKFVPTDNWPNQLLDWEGELKEKQALTR